VVVKAQAQVIEQGAAPAHTATPATQATDTPTLPAVYGSRLARIERAVLGLTEAVKQPATAPKSPAEELRAALDMVKEIQSITKESVREVVAETVGSNKTDASVEKDEDERALLLLLKSDSLRKKVTTSLT